MTQRDLFDSVGRLPESYRLEALEDHPQDAAGEINALFEQDVRRYTDSPAWTANREETSRSADIRDISRTVRKKDQNPFRNLTIGLTAIAAVIALTVGVMVWRVHQETIETIGDPAAASSVQPAVTELQAQTDAAGKSVPETTAEEAIQAEAEAVMTAVPADNPEAVHTAETNIFGGKGALRIIGIQGAAEPITEDAEYWYLGGRGRISKTQTDENGKHVEELICQKPGCPHYNPVECLFTRYGTLLTDGEKIYLPNCKKQGQINPNGSLVRLNPDGTEADFFETNPDEIIGGFRDAGNPADPHEYREIYFYDLIKLGDSGNYLIQGQLQHQNIGLQSISFNVIYTPATQQKIFLPWKMFSWQYDAETRQLFGSASEGGSSKNYVRDAQFYLFDIHTGECVKQSDLIPNLYGALMSDGTVYFIRKTYSEQKMVVDGKQMGGRLDYTDTLCSYDFETGKQTVLLEDTDFDQIQLCGGRLLCKRNAHVGKDQLFYLDPADLSEELVYETPNKIENIWCCTNPDFILLRGTFVNGFLVNGELKHVEFGYF